MLLCSYDVVFFDYIWDLNYIDIMNFLLGEEEITKIIKLCKNIKRNIKNDREYDYEFDC